MYKKGPSIPSSYSMFTTLRTILALWCVCGLLFAAPLVNGAIFAEEDWAEGFSGNAHPFRSIVRVKIEWHETTSEGYEDFQKDCTGFLTDKNELATAYHCILNRSGKVIAELLYRPRLDNYPVLNRWFKVQVRESDLKYIGDSLVDIPIEVDFLQLKLPPLPEDLIRLIKEKYQVKEKFEYLGELIGYFGVRGGQRHTILTNFRGKPLEKDFLKRIIRNRDFKGILPEKLSTKELIREADYCKNTHPNPILWIWEMDSEEVLASEFAHWAYFDDSEKNKDIPGLKYKLPRICVASLPGELKVYDKKDNVYIDHRAVENSCFISGLKQRGLRTSCSTGGGGSGAPIFHYDPEMDSYFAIAIHKTGNNKDAFRAPPRSTNYHPDDNYNIGTLLIPDFLLPWCSPKMESWKKDCPR